MNLIQMQHEVAADYHGCSKCKKNHYPYYWGDDRHFYCEDCVKELVKEKKAEYGRHSVKVPFQKRPKAEPPEPPKDLQAEPAYPIDGMVMLSMRDPEWTGHLKHDECEIEEPHKTESCGLWKPKASPSLEDAALEKICRTAGVCITGRLNESEVRAIVKGVAEEFARQQRREAVAEFVAMLFEGLTESYVTVDEIQAIAKEMDRI